MAEILDTQVATQPVSGVIQLGVGPTTISLVNLGVLGTNTSGPIALSIPAQTQTFTVQQPDGADDAVTVGETFSVVRTVTNTGTGAVVGTPSTATYTMVGSGTISGTLGTPRDVIVAVDGSGNQVLIYPDNNPPALGVVTLTYDVSSVGYDFAADAPLCFARGTMLKTSDGLRAIEDLAEGDLIETKDNGTQPIRWIGSRTIGASTLAKHENLRPIRIKAGALGENTPSSELIVSPQHRILVRSKIAIKMFDSAEVLVAAKQLLQIDGVDIAYDLPEVEYFHMLFEKHEVVFSNGAETESLFTGPEALKTVGPAALEEIYAIFPELKDAAYEAAGARILVSGRQGRKMASRHLQHNRALVSRL